MRTIEDLVAGHPFFRGLEPEYLSLVAGCGSNVLFHAGEYLMREGEPAESFYVIRHGRVAIEISAPGQGVIPVQTVGAGEVLGWSWLVPPYRWEFDGRAVELTRAVAFEAHCLRQKCDEDPRLGYELLKRFVQVVTRRLAATRLQLLDIYGKAS